MNSTKQELLQFVEDHGVRFVDLAFCDLFGRQKVITIMTDELPRAFEYGISFDGSAIEGYSTVEQSDLFLMPDSSTVALVPEVLSGSTNKSMRMFCYVMKPDGTPFEADPRAILRGAVGKAAAEGYICRVGAECEFYLLQTNDQGEPKLLPMDRGTYADIGPLDQGGALRREICCLLSDLGMKPESAHHERGAGQHEVDFRYSDALLAADSVLTFKWLVKTVAAGHRLFASFLPKPFAEDSGNGMHINLSLARGGKNLFQTGGENHNRNVESFIQGILDHAAEITAFLNPIPNSYRRLGAFEAPRYVTWSHQNRSQLVRIPASAGEFSRMELRSADPVCNPYLALALLIAAGLEGVQQQKVLSAPCERNLYEPGAGAGLQMLPQTLEEAVSLAEESELIKNVLPETVRETYLKRQRELWNLFKESPEEEVQYFLPFC